MIILLCDDELSLRETVGAALTDLNHQVYKVDTSNAVLLRKQLADFVHLGLRPDLVILDGHNVLRDTEGNALFDMTPLGLITWMRQNGIEAQTRFLLYSNDDDLVQIAQERQRKQFWRAIPKLGAHGGLKMLLEAVREAAEGH
jgi:CheY-like chemotaxis protein